MTASRMIRLRYRGVCELCGAELPAGATAVYDRAHRKVRGVECPTTAAETPTLRVALVRTQRSTTA